jgi:hypothetical protein
MMDGANRANVSFYPIDARVLAASDRRRDAPDATDAAGRVAALRTLAENTDGLAMLTSNDVPAGVSRLMSDLQSYYLVGYLSTNTTADGGYRRLSVSVKRRGVTVRARRGYRARTAGELERQLTRSAQAGQTPGGGVGAVQAAIAALGELPASAPVRSRVAYGPTSSGRMRIWAVAEIAITISREGGWMGGGTVDASLNAPDNTALTTAESALAGNQRAVLLDLGEIDPPRSPTTLRLRLRPGGEGTMLQDELALAPLPAGNDFGVPLLSRRGATTGGRYLPTANPTFRRTERVRLELPRPAAPGAFTAVLLDRTGAPMALPVVTSTRTEGAVTWAVADVSLAPLAHGDYVLKVTVEGKEVITAIQVVP